MIKFPAPVINYIQNLIIEKRHPAYLLVSKDGCLLNWGGELSVYGITNLQPGEFICDRLDFLQGSLPLDDFPLVLPWVKTEHGLCADIHLFPTDEGDCVLLLDATLEENQHILMQQKGNELSLLRKEQARKLEQSFAQDMNANLEEAVFNIPEKGERRYVTILVANICGLTGYSEKNEPELVFSTLNAYLSTMVQPILDEGGMVDKIIGDAVMTFFGVLPTSGKSPNQAIKAALRMVEGVREVSKLRQADNCFTLDIGIGIASGLVALAIIGNKDRKAFSAIGYHVNMAMRLESEARPNEILIDQNTFDQLETNLKKYFFATNLLGKGMVDPISAYSYLIK